MGSIASKWLQKIPGIKSSRYRPSSEKLEVYLLHVQELIQKVDILTKVLDRAFENLFANGELSTFVKHFDQTVRSYLQELAGLINHLDSLLTENLTIEDKKHIDLIENQLNTCQRDLYRLLEKYEIYTKFQTSGALQFTETKSKIEALVKKGRGSEKESDVILPLLDARQAYWELHEANPFVKDHPEKLQQLENKILEAASFRKILFLKGKELPEQKSASTPNKKLNFVKRKILPFTKTESSHMDLSFWDRFWLWKEKNLYKLAVDLEKIGNECMATISNCRTAKKSERLNDEELVTLIEDKKRRLNTLATELSKHGCTGMASRLENYIIKIQVYIETLRAEVSLRENETIDRKETQRERIFDLSSLKELDTGGDLIVERIFQHLTNQSESGLVTAMSLFGTLKPSSSNFEEVQEILRTACQHASSWLPVVQSWMLGVILPENLKPEGRHSGDEIDRSQLEAIKLTLLREGDQELLNSPIYHQFSNHLRWNVFGYYQICLSKQKWHKKEKKFPKNAVLTGNDDRSGALMFMLNEEKTKFNPQLYYWNWYSGEFTAVNKAYNPLNLPSVERFQKFYNLYKRVSIDDQILLCKAANLESRVDKNLQSLDVEYLLELPSSIEAFKELVHLLDEKSEVRELIESIVFRISLDSERIFNMAGILFQKEVFELLKNEWPKELIGLEDEKIEVETRLPRGYQSILDEGGVLGSWELYPREVLNFANNYYHYRIGERNPPRASTIIGHHDGESLLLYFGGEKMKPGEEYFAKWDLTTCKLTALAGSLEELKKTP